MGYTVEGNFSAHLCRDYVESLANISVRVYRPSNQIKIVKNGTGNTKVLEPLSEEEILGKEQFLIGKAMTDFAGNYEVELAEAYQDGLVEIDLRVKRVPGQQNISDKAVQFTARKLRPVWRFENKRQHYSWNYCFPFQFWSGIRTMFDAWVIFGYVKSSKNKKTPLKNVCVSAHDVDWIQDDYLGSSITDNLGFFRIDYSSADFKRTFLSPVVNLETPFTTMPGPGVYFKVASVEGKLLYEENKSMGRTADRKNLPRCFYVDLYIDSGE